VPSMMALGQEAGLACVSVPACQVWVGHFVSGIVHNYTELHAFLGSFATTGMQVLCKYLTCSLCRHKRSFNLHTYMSYTG
jgi:hypothetical protein